MKKLIIVALSLISVFSETAFSQQDPMYTQYMFNTLSVNPAYAGSRKAFSITGLARQQWLGIDGAPNTQTITMHTPLFKKLAIGVSLVHDEVGPAESTLGYVDLAYHLKLSEKANLSFGLKGGFNFMQVGLTSLDLGSGANDNAFNNNIGGEFLPNFGAGLYYYMDRFYAGISVPKFLENDLSDLSGTSTEKRHSFFILGGVINLIGNDLKLKPTGLLKMVNGAPLEFDITAQFLINDKFGIGPMYRSNDGIGGLLNYQFTDQLRAGYAVDYPLTALNSYYKWSHEIMISYDLTFKSQDKIRSPRYF